MSTDTALEAVARRPWIDDEDRATILHAAKELERLRGVERNAKAVVEADKKCVAHEVERCSPADAHRYFRAREKELLALTAALEAPPVE